MNCPYELSKQNDFNNLMHGDSDDIVRQTNATFLHMYSAKANVNDPQTLLKL